MTNSIFSSYLSCNTLSQEPKRSQPACSTFYKEISTSSLNTFSVSKVIIDNSLIYLSNNKRFPFLQPLIACFFLFFKPLLFATFQASTQFLSPRTMPHIFVFLVRRIPSLEPISVSAICCHKTNLSNTKQIKKNTWSNLCNNALLFVIMLWVFLLVHTV